MKNEVRKVLCRGHQQRWRLWWKQEECGEA